MAKKFKVSDKVKKAPKKTMQTVLGGALMNSDFFYKHKLKIFLLLTVIMFFISTKYQCQTGMETIRKLEKKVNIVRAETIREKAMYMSRVRESSIAVIVDTVRPGLQIQPQPTYTLSQEELDKITKK